MRIVQRCGNDFYEKYVRPALMLPSVRHIQRKWSALDTGGAGICTELIAQYARIATEKLFDEWECSGCISTDSMVVRDGLGWNPHRGEITGFDTHGNAAGVIAGEFGAASKRLAVRAQSEVPLESLTNEAAKHYSVAIFTSFGSYMTEDGERRAIQLVASRHAMAVMRPEHIAADLNAAVQALEAHCFHVKCISLDGAGENEAATKKLCTRSLRDLVDRADLDLQRLNLADADLDLKIAWLHPITQEPIFFISDMGHVVKRIVNALESSSDPNSKRKMRYVVDEPEVMAYPRTVCMNLSMLSDAFTAAEREDQSSAVGGPFALRTNRKLGKGHFCKNAHSRMSVPLAVQVLSDSMRELIVVMLQRDGTANLAREYKGMLELVVRVNRLVDICNCRGYDVHPPALAINSPHHPLLGELAETMTFFTKWRMDIDRCPDFATSPERENAKLSIETHTGLQRLILGIIGTALCFLPKTRSPWAFNPRRAQSDPCEHEFSMNRFGSTGGNPTMQAAFRSTAARGATLLAARTLEHNGYCAHAHAAAQLPAFQHAGANSSYAAPAHGNKYAWPVTSGSAFRVRECGLFSLTE